MNLQYFKFQMNMRLVQLFNQKETLEIDNKLQIDVLISKIIYKTKRKHTFRTTVESQYSVFFSISNGLKIYAAIKWVFLVHGREINFEKF